MKTLSAVHHGTGVSLVETTPNTKGLVVEITSVTNKSGTTWHVKILNVGETRVRLKTFYRSTEDSAVAHALTCVQELYGGNPNDKTTEEDTKSASTRLA